MVDEHKERVYVIPGQFNPNKRIIATAHPVQGLTCFHEYQERTLKTLTIDMLYTAIGALQTQTNLALGTPKTEIIFSKNEPSEKVKRRVEDYVREYFDGNFYLNTHNNFQPDVGLASSASGFSCIAGGLARLLNLTDDLSEISKMARTGSFSASASVTGGISIVRKKELGHATYGEQVFSPAQLDDLTLVIALASYNKDTFDFYREAETSPVLETARKQVESTADQMIRSFEERDVDKLAYLSERNVTMNYAVLHTGDNNLFLWKPESVIAISGVRRLRQKGEPVFYSMNTGANVFVYCFNDSSVQKMKTFLGSQNIEYLVSKVGGGLRCQ